MAKLSKIILLMLFSVFLFTTIPAHAEYQLAWSDEFDGTQLNSSNWEHQVFGGAGTGNNELQYYTDRPENSYVADGYLHIVAREEQYEGYDYTSARIHSAGRQDFLYGRMEARIKIPGGQGYWPAFWMMPTEWAYGGWAASGEIDILEAVNKMDYIRGSVHYGGVYPDNFNSFGDYREGRGPKATIFSDDFHVYSIEWEPTQFRWYVDGNHYYTRDNSGWWCDTAPWNDLAPFDEEFHFIMNVAIGGNWPGAPDASTVFPQEMLIDYVRVYQVANVAPTVTLTSPSNGANLPAGSTTITADASDSDGTIQRVRFFAGSSFLGEDSTAPYSMDWGATDGCYTLKVWTMDDLGGIDEDSIDVTVGIGCPQLPYYGTPQAIPGQIEAEDFDSGLNGEAYYDYDAGNNGGQYRPDDDVDIEACGEGGYNVGWISDGEWMDYQVDVASAGVYTIETRVASIVTGGAFHIEFDGIDKTGSISVPVTGGWQNWVTVSANADLSAGLQEMTFVKEGSNLDEFNLNYYNITSGGSSYCGDDTCDPGEDQCNCPEDCGTPPSTETSCTDGEDNDCDTDVDCDDADCIGDPACPSCGDGTCDPGEDQCNCPDDCGIPPSTETSCDDGIDNDCDNDVDCDDTDCDGDPACPDCLPKGADCTDNAECCSGNCLPAGRCK